MLVRLLLVSALSALIPSTYLLSDNQKATAFLSASDTELPGGGAFFCTSEQVAWISVLDVTVNNTDNKFVIATVGSPSGGIYDMELMLESPGGSNYDHAFAHTDGDRHAALTWTGTSSGQYEVRIQSTGADNVCLYDIQSDLRIMYE